jgi:hypothetical protein
MATRRKPASLPSLPPEQGIGLIQQQIAAGERLKHASGYPDSNDLAHWKTVTEGILRRINPSFANGFFNAAHPDGARAQITKLRAYVDLLKIEVQHPTPAEEPDKPKVATSIHVHGPNARVNLNSVDNSSNTAVTSSLDWSALRSAMEAVQDQALRQRAVQVVHRLESQVGERGYAAGYKDLISLLADHLTILLPFLPALTATLHS